MALQIGRALGRGLRRAASTSGVVLTVATFAYQLVFLGSTYTLVVELVPPEQRAAMESEVGFTLPVSAAVAAVLALLGLVVGTALYVVAARALSRDPAALSSFPSDLYARRIGRATLSAIGANVFVSAAMFAVFALVAVPLLFLPLGALIALGAFLVAVPVVVFLSVSFLFVVFAIGVEDEGAVDALRRSWDLASGHRWRLLAIFVVFGALSGLASGAGTTLSLVDPLVGELVTIGLVSIASVAGYGVFADAFVQLREDEGGPGGPGTTGAGEPSAI
ncbi:hypothetical protein [Halomicrobium salinisoli]|uniref:hypothetical protein n=1 Tax=Halomicrobium salinisoli TaxID=2878391 RepID=UPI001CF0BADF|nr:hypothetical protein [Halomicrobium salinisoli]